MPTSVRVLRNANSAVLEVGSEGHISVLVLDAKAARGTALSLLSTSEDIEDNPADETGDEEVAEKGDGAP